MHADRNGSEVLNTLLAASDSGWSLFSSRVSEECQRLDAKTRRDALDQAIAELAATPPYVDVVDRLVCLRGVSTLTALALTGACAFFCVSVGG